MNQFILFFKSVQHTLMFASLSDALSLGVFCFISRLFRVRAIFLHVCTMQFVNLTGIQKASNSNNCKRNEGNES